MATLSCKIYVAKQGYFCARATSDRNEVSQHKEVRVWIPDGRSYMDVKQHYIQNFIYSARCKVTFAQGEMSNLNSCHGVLNQQNAI
ncbi:hypothetical protein MTsN2n4_28850 [Pseudoalteromonas sp. MTN2-4]